MKTPADKSLSFTFHSHPEKDMSLRWKIKLHFPGGATAEAMLPITVHDGNGAPVKSGVFEFAGQRLAVSDGRSELRYADFVKGKHEKSVWLYRDGMKPVPGGLTFE